MTSLITNLQIQSLILTLADWMSVTCCACVGGVNMRELIPEVKRGAQIVVGTPGKIYDMISRRALG